CPIPLPPRSPLFPYTTLFRSLAFRQHGHVSLAGPLCLIHREEWSVLIQADPRLQTPPVDPVQWLAQFFQRDHLRLVVGDITPRSIGFHQVIAHAPLAGADMLPLEPHLTPPPLPLGHGFLNTQTSSWGTLNLAFAPFRMPGHSTCTRSMSCSPCRCNSSACHTYTRTISPRRMRFLQLTTMIPPGRSTRIHPAQIRQCASRYASPHCIWPVLAGVSGRPRAWRYVYRLDPSRALWWSAMRFPYVGLVTMASNSPSRAHVIAAASPMCISTCAGAC